ncbi:GGDEF domain-containing protein [Parasphingorhabdus halotolerans]|uniref:Diguanylate cyclase n=1 Tax=Parasphingorhabdus halotolerans TaxID=2725558 RepID=A0A6H2DQX1_9SPHN|nr:diguanylate cyclase [Parasphingorhabdus halotolerans]QJB70355.1 diguanylate cyclase [Parasphingorhabdus halotolerans]
MNPLLNKIRQYWHHAKTATGSDVPADILDDLVQLQHERVGALIPVLYFAIALITVVAAAASGDGFDIVYHIILPAGFLGMGIYRSLVWHRRKSQPVDVKQASAQLRSTTILALVVGLVGGLWTVDAYYETIEARRVLAPVFVFMITFASAICLNSLPRAAIGAMVAALTAPTVAMILSADAGIRAMGISLMIVSLLMIGLVINNFAEMVSGLKLRLELKRLAETDSLTGLANRRAFTAKFSELLDGADADNPVAVLMIDLNGFKSANDRFGHAAGDSILIDVAKRLMGLCANADCIARLGGDEFTVLFSTRGKREHYIEQKNAISKLLSMPYTCGDEQVFITASSGLAWSRSDGDTVSMLLNHADKQLYREKTELYDRRKA